jgi:hypothetical protein
MPGTTAGTPGFLNSKAGEILSKSPRIIDTLPHVQFMLFFDAQGPLCECLAAGAPLSPGCFGRQTFCNRVRAPRSHRKEEEKRART